MRLPSFALRAPASRGFHPPAIANAPSALLPDAASILRPPRSCQPRLPSFALLPAADSILLRKDFHPWRLCCNYPAIRDPARRADAVLCSLPLALGFINQSTHLNGTILQIVRNSAMHFEFCACTQKSGNSAFGQSQNK
uniref:Uncharacterized protein n=1 Tax=Zea mays TaxID=4577 RepID=A0A804RL49_MAIZE